MGWEADSKIESEGLSAEGVGGYEIF